MMQVWSRRYMLLKELYARRALHEVKKMKEIAEEEMGKLNSSFAAHLHSSA